MENIALCVFAAVMYWGTCRLFAAYDQRCFSGAFYVNVKNKYLWLLLGGRCWGKKEIARGELDKLSILGLVAYIALLPVLLSFCAAILDIADFDARSGIALAAYGFAVVSLHVLDEILGNIFYRQNKLRYYFYPSHVP